MSKERYWSMKISSDDFLCPSQALPCGQTARDAKRFPFFHDCWLKDGAKSWQPEQT
jgi:hypothetical protein